MEGLGLIACNESVFLPAQAPGLVLPSLSHLPLESPRERTQDTQLWAGKGGGEAQSRDTEESGLRSLGSGFSMLGSWTLTREEKGKELGECSKL